MTLVGGGEIGPADLALALERAPALVAADGGADAALAAGLRPDLVIGDLDSLSAGARARLGDRIVHVAEQDSTDFEKCLGRIEAPFVLGVGFLGGRLDHALAVLSRLVGPGPRCVLLGARDVAVALRPGTLALDLEAGTRVSLFPMAPVRGVSEGLLWPIAGIDFAPSGRIGTSNRASGPVRLTMAGPGMVLIVPREALGAVLRAVAAGEA